MKDLEYELGLFFRGRQFKKLTERISADTRAKFGLKQIDLDILSYLSANGEATATEIHRTLGLNKGHVSQALTALCARGLVRLKANPFDRRIITIQLTEHAGPIVENIRRERAQMMEKVLRGFTPEELDRMRDFTLRLLSNIRALEES